MKILIVGNGFDLAHGLPTRYIDFLNFISKIQKISSNTGELNKYKLRELSQDEKLNEFDRSYLKKNLLKCNEPNLPLKELIKLSYENFWIEHFNEKKKILNEGWIDFELEIANVIKNFHQFYIDVIIKNIDLKNVDHNVKTFMTLIVEKCMNISHVQAYNYLSNSMIKNYCHKWKEKIFNDLNKLIRCLEIYLEDYLKEIRIDSISPDIEGINFDKILSFNYTNTYIRVYNPYGKTIDCDFIHGRAKISNSIESNNMVLGIDEYLSDELKDKDTTFIEFKKYYQRIHKKTGCKYKKWLKKIKDETNEKHEIYIFGHSLNITDGDIIAELINCKNVKTTIFYNDKETYGRQIANLVKILGVDNLINKVYSGDEIITFKEQRPMISLEKTEFKIKMDIYYLYHIYELKSSIANELVQKVKNNISQGNIEYFKTQRNVISIYDALIELGESDFKDDLLNIALKISDKTNWIYIEFKSEEWSDYNFTGESIACSKKTIDFIDLVNKKNKEKLKHNYKIQISNVIDCNNIEKLTDYHIRDMGILSKIMDMLLKKFDKSEEMPKQIWKCIYNIINITDDNIIIEYIENGKKNAKSLILMSRFDHMKELLREKLYYKGIIEDYAYFNDID